MIVSLVCNTFLFVSLAATKTPNGSKVDKTLPQEQVSIAFALPVEIHDAMVFCLCE